MELKKTIEKTATLTAKAKNGDRHAIKTLMFPFRYGQKRDETTGKLRAYTEEELKVIHDRITNR